MASFKKIFGITIAIASGIVLVAVMLFFLAFFWFQNRPLGESLFVASVSHRSEDDSGVSYYYNLENKTSQDYTLYRSSTRLMVIRKDGALLELSSNRLAYSQFIPAKAKVLYRIHIEGKDDASAIEERYKGFVTFFSGNGVPETRYKWNGPPTLVDINFIVTFPKAW